MKHSMKFSVVFLMAFVAVILLMQCSTCYAGDTISIDGNASDWSDAELAFIDKQDSVYGPNNDIKRVYTTIDGEYACFMVETYGLPINPDAEMSLLVDYKYSPYVFERLSDLHIAISGNTLTASTTDGNMIDLESDIAWGDVFEFQIPLSELEDTTYVSIEAINLRDYSVLPEGDTMGCDPTRLFPESNTFFTNHYGYHDDIGFGLADNYNVASVLTVSRDTYFNPENNNLSTIKWGEELCNYIHMPNWGVRGGFDNFSLAYSFVSFSEDAPDLSLWGDEIYEVSIENYGKYSFEVPSDFLRYIDVPNATFDLDTKTISWSAVDGAAVYNVLIYNTDEDGNYDRGYPLYSTGFIFSQSENGEFSYIFPDSAPLCPGKILAVEAVEVLKGSRAYNISRYHLKIPLATSDDGPIPYTISPYVYTNHYGYNLACKSDEYFMRAFMVYGCDCAEANIEWDGDLYDFELVPGFPVDNGEFYYTEFASATSPMGIGLWEGSTYTLNIDGYESFVFDLGSDVFQFLEVPVATYNQTTKTVTWEAVDGATNYIVRIYPRLPGNVVDVKNVLYASDRLVRTSFTVPLGAPINVDTVLTVEATQFVEEEEALNISRFYLFQSPVGDIIASFDPVAVGEEVIARAPILESDAVTISGVNWNWGDGSEVTPGSVLAESVEGYHTYTEAGIYTITMIVADENGCSYDSSFQHVVVCNSDGGFVTGGGWIESPEGAYRADSTLVGRANFGFVSKYKKRATIPTGNTQFQFKIANLKFHSCEYDWLVVAGSKAMYKGSGTINGEGDFGFMLSATDEQLTPSTDIDLFRIKIWDKENNDMLVYDNQLDAYGGENLTTAIQGGNIIIHKK